MYGIVSEMYHTCCVHFCMYLIFSSRSKKYSLIFLYNEQIWWSYVSEIASPVISLLEWLLLPHINIVILFLVEEMGLKSYSMSFHQVCILIILKYRNDMYQKLIIHRHIPIRNFICVLISEHIVYFIFLWITYLKLLFLDSFLSRNLIWHSPYCIHMVCHLHFRKHNRFINYNFHNFK